MKLLVVVATACSLLQHLLLGCCWHHETCAHVKQATRACHAGHQAHDATHAHGDQEPTPTDSHSECTEGRCWWVADHASPQPPLLELTAEVLLPVASSPCMQAAVASPGHLPHGIALPALPLRAHLWNQILLI